MFTYKWRIFGRRLNNLNFRVVHHFLLTGFVIKWEFSIFNRITIRNSYKTHFKHTKTCVKKNCSEHNIRYILRKWKQNMSQNQWSAVVCGVLYKYSAECAMKLKKFASLTKVCYVCMFQLHWIKFKSYSFWFYS